MSELEQLAALVMQAKQLAEKIRDNSQDQHVQGILDPIRCELADIYSLLRRLA
jgi:ribosomal protein S15P/S13E